MFLTITNSRIIEVRTGQDFRVLPGPFRGSLASTEAWIPFIPTRIKPDLFTVCYNYCVINTRFSHGIVNANNSWISYLTECSQHVRCFSTYLLSWHTFSLRKGKYRKARYEVWLLSCEPGQNSEHDLYYQTQARPSGQARAHAELYPIGRRNSVTSIEHELW
jgi:hypothetical protein